MPRSLIFDIAVIGGGAAGFFAAITASELASPKHLKILIIEKAKNPLGKVLISGGGRCNVTHACFDPDQLVTYYPRGMDALRGAFTRFQPADTIAWFESHGVLLKTEPDGRVFPRSDSSRSITNCLLNSVQAAGIKIMLNAAVESIELDPHTTNKPRFHIKTRTTGRIDQNNEISSHIFARRVLLCTGGDRNSFDLASRLGHTIEPPVASLFSFKIVDPRLEDLAGLSVNLVTLTLEELPPHQNRRTHLSSQEGPLLVTHWGLSGPAVLKLSAWGARWLHARQYQAGLQINWLHQYNSHQVATMLLEIKNKPSQGAQKISTKIGFPHIPLRLWNRLIVAAGISGSDKWANVSRNKIQHLAEELTQSHYTIQGKGPYRDEFVTCGGVKLDEINFKTMESRMVPGLFLAGEIIDVDGLTGGFNFQNAWTTGWIAGRSLALSLIKPA